jgi:hypothetical protein
VEGTYTASDAKDRPALKKLPMLKSRGQGDVKLRR